MGVTQQRVSAIESDSMAELATLADYIHALGGQLKVIADFGDSWRRSLTNGTCLDAPANVLYREHHVTLRSGSVRGAKACADGALSAAGGACPR
jgi:hypothetical protein